MSSKRERLSPGFRLLPTLGIHESSTRNSKYRNPNCGQFGSDQGPSGHGPESQIRVFHPIIFRES